MIVWRIDHKGKLSELFNALLYTTVVHIWPILTGGLGLSLIIVCFAYFLTRPNASLWLGKILHVFMFLKYFFLVVITIAWKDSSMKWLTIRRVGG